jgi:hypothetical protein
MSVITNQSSTVFDDNVVSSADIIFRIEELECLSSDCNITEDEITELCALKAFESKYDFVTEWQYGAHFIAEEYFTEYVKDMLEGCGTIPRDLPDYVAIDWEETADNLKCDYTDAEFNGVNYYVLSV